jgi:uncharacterized protein (DUF983 family)
MSEPDFRDLPSLFSVGVKGRCPRCGEGALFKGFLALEQRCDACGLDYGFAESGDGPAAFIMMIAGAVVLGSALIVDAYYEPPLLILAAIFLPLMLIVCLGLMRPAKGLLIASQYHHKAAQIINPD